MSLSTTWGVSAFKGGAIMRFINEQLKPDEIPTAFKTVEEIDLVFFTQLQGMYYMLSDECLNAEDMVEQMMFVFLAQWDNWKEDFFNHFRKANRAKDRQIQAWVEQNKDFICELAELDNNGVDIVPILHGFIKQRLNESAEAKRSNVTEQ